MEEQINSQTNPEIVAATPAAEQTAGEAGGAAQAAPSETQQDQPQQQAPDQQQPQQPPQSYHLPPGYAVDPATGQVVFVGQAYQQPVQPGYVQPGFVYVQQQPTPEQVAALQAGAQQRYGQVINSVERFLEGETSVSDVVKTLYTNTARDDQLWKGVIVGAAAVVLLTSGPVREAMGKTFGGIFPGLKESKQPSGAAATAAEETTAVKPTTDKE